MKNPLVNTQESIYQLFSLSVLQFFNCSIINNQFISFYRTQHAAGSYFVILQKLLASFMKLKIYQVDAFADKVFSGNSAAVCPLSEWPSDNLLQQIAMENNLAETAFYVKRNGVYELRWFTPTVEVDLCGHATLAAAYVLFNCEQHDGDSISFFSPRSGALGVRQSGEQLILDFPKDRYSAVEMTKELRECFSIDAREAYKGKTDYMLVFDNEEQISQMMPNLSAIALLDARGIIITAPGERSDFVSRFFAPQSGIDEDPVTGSSHTTLSQYWSARLAKQELSAVQISSRRGFLQCLVKEDRVEIGGRCFLYMKGEILIA